MCDMTYLGGRTWVIRENSLFSKLKERGSVLKRHEHLKVQFKLRVYLN